MGTSLYIMCSLVNEFLIIWKPNKPNPTDSLVPSDESGSHWWQISGRQRCLFRVLRSLQRELRPRTVTFSSNSKPQCPIHLSELTPRVENCICSWVQCDPWSHFPGDYFSAGCPGLLIVTVSFVAFEILNHTFYLVHFTLKLNFKIIFFVF